MDKKFDDILQEIEQELNSVLTAKETKILMSHYREELFIVDKFYNKTKAAIREHHNYTEKQADFETYRWILQNTDKPPKDFMKIFGNIPKQAQKNIIKYMGYKSEKEFKKKFSQHMSIYKQSADRRDDKYEKN